MKKLLKGFTLAEILITLTIVGIVARMTLPSLMQNVQVQTTEASLSKAINTLEMGNQRILQETGSRSLSGAGVSSANNANQADELNTRAYLNLMNNYMNGSYRSSLTLSINGTSRANQNAFITKDGIMFADASSISGLTEPIARSSNNGPSGPDSQVSFELGRQIPQKYHGSYAKILVDINGTSGPNQLAKDQFIFYIDNYGSAIAYGGAEYGRYALDNGLVMFPVGGSSNDSSTPLWQRNNTCSSGVTPTTTAAKAACTGSIIDNNFKVIYTY